MGKRVDFQIHQVPGGYRARAGAYQVVRPSLEGFGTFLLGEVQRGNPALRVEFRLSDDLRANFALCGTCEGEGRVKTDGIAAQFVANDLGTIDFDKKPTATCPTCRGLGADIPNFWSS
jgi:hypothetical protein